MPRSGSPYDHQYRKARAALLAPNPRCQLRITCGGVLADSADHDPPLALHEHVNGTSCCRLIPACIGCQREQGKQVAALKRARAVALRPVPTPSRVW